MPKRWITYTAGGLAIALAPVLLWLGLATPAEATGLVIFGLVAIGVRRALANELGPRLAELLEEVVRRLPAPPSATLEKRRPEEGNVRRL